ncbi:hypothetical protein HS088_TW02G01088 [Tripterygium wilfordii]|uniref:CLAVATA3/ESR (CLE)-related protein 9-like n=1 Tax=Tripterygium wilfordii TaxID=458696 RepID=A0A7J7E0E1_TRIWF|nr:hypothetical protein HS088_TW02G01088 [Tripterygium wilfordii]
MSFPRILLLVVLFLFFFASPTAPETSYSINQHKYTTTYHRRRRHMHSCHEKMYPRSLCIRFQRINNKHPPPPPPYDGDEIDPRYGVEKRLVPSGPNPLHN